MTRLTLANITPQLFRLRRRDSYYIGRRTSSLNILPPLSISPPHNIDIRGVGLNFSLLKKLSTYYSNLLTIISSRFRYLYRYPSRKYYYRYTCLNLNDSR